METFESLKEIDDQLNGSTLQDIYFVSDGSILMEFRYGTETKILKLNNNYYTSLRPMKSIADLEE